MQFDCTAPRRWKASAPSWCNASMIPVWSWNGWVMSSTTSKKGPSQSPKWWTMMVWRHIEDQMSLVGWPRVALPSSQLPQHQSVAVSRNPQSAAPVPVPALRRLEELLDPPFRCKITSWAELHEHVIFANHNELWFLSNSLHSFLFECIDAGLIF